MHLIQFIVLAICLPKIINFGGDLTKFWQQQVGSFFGTPCMILIYISEYLNNNDQHSKTDNSVKMFWTQLCHYIWQMKQWAFFRGFQYKKAPLLLGKTRYWPSRTSTVDDFHLIWKGVCHFPLMINSNLGPISHRFRDMASFQLKNAHFSYPSVQPHLWKCSTWTASQSHKFCTQRVSKNG